MNNNPRGESIDSVTSQTAPNRIAIYLHTLFNGGIERVMFNLIQGFLDRGITVDLVLDFLVYSPFEGLFPDRARLVKLDANNFAKRITRLSDYLRVNSPDVLLSATHFSNEVACVAKIVSRSKTRIVLSEHTNLSSDIADSRRWIRRVLLPWTTRNIYPLADGVVAVSNGVADDMCHVSGLPRTKVQTIYNPIDRGHLLKMAQEPLDSSWFGPGQPPVILGIGRLETQKNFSNLLHAFQSVRQGREAKLVILGEGSQRERLTATIAELGLKESVSLPGFVANPVTYIAKSAVFAMSSAWEGMPVSLIEALMLGTPVVSTDCPSGPAEILDGGRYGRLVPPNDSSALASAIDAALDGDRKPADETWLAQFDADKITEKYLDLMSSSTRSLMVDLG